MKNTLIISFALLVGLMTVCESGFAHHGTNVSYDMKKHLTMTGTVTEFVWSNPHCQLYFDVKDDKGNVVRWGGEMNSPGVLARAGWSRHELKPGDQITITLSPSKAGTHLGVVSKIVLPDGRELKRPGGGGGGED
jgi:uncharacterized protein DUF6152